MKNIFIFILYIYSILCIFSCDKKAERDGYKDPVIVSLDGTWNIIDNNIKSGIIKFDSSTETLEIQKDSNYCIADFNLTNTYLISISYAVDKDENELLSDSDYDNGGIECEIKYNNESEVNINNLPYYRNKWVILKK